MKDIEGEFAKVGCDSVKANMRDKTGTKPVCFTISIDRLPSVQTGDFQAQPEGRSCYCSQPLRDEDTLVMFVALPS